MLQNYDVTKLWCYKIMMLQNYDVTKLWCYKIMMLQNYDVTKLWSYKITWNVQNHDVTHVQDWFLPAFPMGMVLPDMKHAGCWGPEKSLRAFTRNPNTSAGRSSLLQPMLWVLPSYRISFLPRSYLGCVTFFLFGGGGSGYGWVHLKALGHFSHGVSVGSLDLWV